MPGKSFQFAATVTDPDGAAPAFAWTVNGQLQAGVTGSHFSFRVPEVREALGAYTVGITVSDRRGGVGSASRVVRALLPDRWAAVSSNGILCTRADIDRSARLLTTSGPVPEPRTEIVFSLLVYDSLAIEVRGEPVTWRPSNAALFSIANIAGTDDQRIRPLGEVGETWLVGTSGEAVDSMRVKLVRDALTDC